MTTNRHSTLQSSAPHAWKFESPRLAEPLLPRDQLVARIEQHLGRKRGRGDVMLLSAPPGYGKSTLLAQWAQTTDVPVAWYHLDTSDDDPVMFIRGVMRALKTQLPPRGRWATKGVVENIRGGALTPPDLRRAVDVLSADIRAHLSQPLALVLTGVDHLKSRMGARVVLDGLLSRQPDPLRLALEVREVPALRVSPLLAQRRLEGLGLEDLMLSDAELVALLERIGIEADATYTAGLRDLCGGWVMGVLLATGALWPDCIAARASEALNREAVFAYLAHEVVDRLPSELSDFATRAATLSYMTAPLCERLLGIENAREQLAALEQRTGFVTHVGRRPQEPVYRFQPLLRNTLLDNLEQRASSPDEVRELHRRAGDCLDELGDAEEAVQQYARASAYERLVAVIERDQDTMLRAGRGATLVRWIELLPTDIRARHTRLQIVLAEQQRIVGQTAEAYETIEHVCERLFARDASAAEANRETAARALLVRGDLHFIQGRYECARRDCEQAIALLPDDADDLHVKALFLLTVSVNAIDGPKAAAACLDGAEARCARLDDLWAMARLYYVRSNLAIASGAYREAEAAAATGLLYAQEANDEVRAIACRLNLGAIRQHLGQMEAARADLEAALAQAEAIGHAQGRVYALANLADAELNTGNYQRALTLAERTAREMDGVDDQHLRLYIAAVAGYALSQLGRVDDALAHINAALATLREDEQGVDRLLLTIALGHAHYRRGDLDRADVLISQSITHAREHGAQAELARAQLVRAATYLARDLEEAARQAVIEALEAGMRLDGAPSILLAIRHLPALWPLLRELDHPLAASLLAQLGGAERAPANAEDASETRRMPVRVHLLGDSRVFVGDEQVTRWARPKLRELLLYLLDQRGPVRKDVLIDDIWPEKSPETADDEFRKARSELKKLLGGPCLEQVDGRWRLTIECWVDTHEFERLVEAGERNLADGRISAAAAAWREAAGLWNGSYLSDVYSDWASARRHEQHRRQLDLLERLAQVEMELRQYDAAARLFYQILDLEPHNEASHRGLMKYFMARGEAARALTQFQTCYEALQSELGISPSAQTVQLYQAIRVRLGESARGLAVRNAAS